MNSRLRIAALLLSLGSAPLLSQTPDTARYTILMAKGPSGVVNAWTESDGTRGFFMEYNDRGRGPALTERMKLGPDGFPRALDINGYDYFKGPVDEHFVVEQSGTTSRARWKNTAES